MSSTPIAQVGEQSKEMRRVQLALPVYMLQRAEGLALLEDSSLGEQLRKAVGSYVLTTLRSDGFRGALEAATKRLEDCQAMCPDRLDEYNERWPIPDDPYRDSKKISLVCRFITEDLDVLRQLAVVHNTSAGQETTKAIGDYTHKMTSDPAVQQSAIEMLRERAARKVLNGDIVAERISTAFEGIKSLSD